MKNKSRWDSLSMKDRAILINMYAKGGYTNLDDIKKHYNSFGEGGLEEGYTASSKEEHESQQKEQDKPWYYKLQELGLLARNARMGNITAPLFHHSSENNIEPITLEVNNKYITEDNYKEELSKFRVAFEEFYPEAYYDAKGKKYTIGTGLTYLIDSRGKEIPIKKGDKISKEENLRQLNLREERAEKYALKETEFWDKYHPELKFQILDAMFNTGNANVWHKSPKYQQALREYEKAEGWNNPNYDLTKIFQHADWNLNDSKWLGLRSRMRRNPQAINPEDYNLIYNNKFRDSLRTNYEEKYRDLLK